MHTKPTELCPPCMCMYAGEPKNRVNLGQLIAYIEYTNKIQNDLYFSTISSRFLHTIIQIFSLLTS